MEDEVTMRAIVGLSGMCVFLGLWAFMNQNENVFKATSALGIGMLIYSAFALKNIGFAIAAALYFALIACGEKGTFFGMPRLTLRHLILCGIMAALACGFYHM